MTLTNCNWEQMVNGPDNCCLLLTNHKQTLTHEPHCLLWNIIPSGDLQVNYFSSFQTLSADSLAKFVRPSQQEAHQLPSSTEPWTHQVTKKPPCTLCSMPYIEESMLHDRSVGSPHLPLTASKLGVTIMALNMVESSDCIHCAVFSFRTTDMKSSY
jgi:hypothetical protein